MFVRLRAWLGFGYEYTGEQRKKNIMVVSSFGMIGRPGHAYPASVWQKCYRHKRTGKRVWRTVW